MKRGCRHEDVEPVTLLTGEVVGGICADPECGISVPKNWGGQTSEVRRLCDVEAMYHPVP